MPDYVFACDYCATYVPVNAVINYYEPRRGAGRRSRACRHGHLLLALLR